MGFGMGLGTGLRGLNAARFAMQVIGQNVSNANTPGYTRQRVLLGTTFPITLQTGMHLGTGVQIDAVQRILDGRLQARIRTQNGLFGYADTDFRRLSEIEGVFGEPGQGGLSGMLNGFFTQVDKLRSDAGSRALRGGLLQASKNLTGGFNLLADRFDTLKNDTINEVQGYLKEVNSLAKEIATLNTQITTLESNGNQANELRDRRETAIQGLSALMETQALERKNGSLDILAGGYLLVSGGSASTLRAAKNSENLTQIYIGNTTSTISPKEGKIAALLNSEKESLPGITSRLDTLARKLALETNRIHTTGMPKSGPFTSLLAENPIVDGDGDKQFSDELLAFGQFPFDVAKGSLYISVSDLETGDLERTEISIDPKSMTLGDLASEISKISHLNASVDPTGRLRILSDSGYGFDFSKRLDSNPNSAKTFGSQHATIGGTVSGPFDLSSLPADFQISVDGGSATTISLTASDFKVPSSVSAKELAAVINSKFSSASLSATAVVVGNNISITATSSGTTSSLLLTDGTNTPLSTIGLLSGSTVNGRSDTVAVSISGTFAGEENGFYRFVPEGDGDIGVTDGLKVAVYDKEGTKVASLDVGSNYSFGDKLEVGNGVEIAFGPGTISKTNGDQIALDTLSDPDTSDLLVGLGLNIFFTGSKASDIGVSERLEGDPDLISAGFTQAAGDSQNLALLANLRTKNFEELSGGGLENYYADIASDVGFETKKAKELLKSQDALLGFLQTQRESISGVNIDEEMVDLVRFQQAFQASSRFINVVSQMTESLIQLGR
ncbi:MAG TPA: flagellar hook-associated protein FlgK [Planctomycetes bacterium]|nr:flagellar hook-associated protein FlgK [Planctomycetota bacterium]